MMKYALVLTMVLVLGMQEEAFAQFKNLGKKIENKVNRRIEQKTDKAIDKGLDKTEQGAEEAIKGNPEEPNSPSKSSPQNQTESVNSNSSETNTNSPKSFTTYSKFDFVPGEKTMFYDDFSQDMIGDFPAKWNTNGSGEVVNTDEGEKWFELKGKSVFIPGLNQPLPENYTIEFDIRSTNMAVERISNRFLIMLDDNNLFNNGKNSVRVYLPFYSQGQVQVRNLVDGNEVINNHLPAEIGKQMNHGGHVSITVNKRRFRLYMDEEKILDLPTLVPVNIKYLKFVVEGFTNDFNKYQFYISNLKIAEGRSDLRSKLLTEGKFTTQGIYFDINSDRIKPESNGVLKDLAAVLSENPEVRVKIIGHTDADGDDAANLELSKKRAASVKQTLSSVYGIQDARIETDGKGESNPIDNNQTTEGKANNRRVEFVKL